MPQIVLVPNPSRISVAARIELARQVQRILYWDRRRDRWNPDYEQPSGADVIQELEEALERAGLRVKDSRESNAFLPVYDRVVYDVDLSLYWMKEE